MEAANTLVKEHLIACANIFDSVTSVYEWNDKIESNQEVVIILKTSKDSCKKAIIRTKELHPYESPCIIAFKNKKGDKNYIKWVENYCKV